MPQAAGRQVWGPPFPECRHITTYIVPFVIGMLLARDSIIGICWRSGNGGPQTCLPAAYGVAQRGAQHGPSSSTQIQDPREGPSLAGRTTRSFLRHGLIRLAREEAEISRRGTSRGARDASHDDQRRQAGASRAVSSFPLWCKGSKRRREQQAKAPVSVQRDQDQSNGREEVIVEPKLASPLEPLAGKDQL